MGSTTATISFSPCDDSMLRSNGIHFGFLISLWEAADLNELRLEGSSQGSSRVAMSLSGAGQEG